MKQTIYTGAYGWRHEHWSGSFYPQELPVVDDDDWRLSYYSNEFNTVLVPATYWQGGQSNDCGDWLDSVHDEFRFFVACHASMLDAVSLAELSHALQTLKPQLSALVFLNEHQTVSDEVKKPFIELADSLAVELFGELPGLTMQQPVQKIWQPDAPVSGSRFAFVDDDLSDLRAARVTVEQFVAHSKGHLVSTEATIIVDHPQLQASNLSKFRSMLEIMGH